MVRLALFGMAALAALWRVRSLHAQDDTADSGFEPLFNGDDLTGWVQVGATASGLVGGGRHVGLQRPRPGLDSAPRRLRGLYPPPGIQDRARAAIAASSCGPVKRAGRRSRAWRFRLLTTPSTLPT